MKRWLVLALTMLFMATALAESPIHAFRGGIRWGMSREEVLAAEGDPQYEVDREKGMDAVILANATFQDAPCTVIYLFLDDQLAMARFEYDMAADGVSFDGLAERLTEAYGEPTLLDTALLENLLLDDESIPERFYGWALEEDTLICLTENRSEESVQIMFSDLRDVP